jgi:hypothetical protein
MMFFSLRSRLTTAVFIPASYIPPLCRFLLNAKNRRALNRYAQNPAPIIPPNAVKRLVILENFVRTHQEIFVETGTYYGETSRLLAGFAKKVMTVELSSMHHRAAKRITAASNVEMTLGDSRAFLTRGTPALRGKICFFLDAHPTNAATTPDGEIDIPIMEELYIVNANPDTSLIIIDDAIGGEGYPSVDAVVKFAAEHSYSFNLTHNMMVLEKRAAAS